MTNPPDLNSHPTIGTEALEDGWVAAAKNVRKSAPPAPPELDPASKDSESWLILRDGWDKHK